MAISMTEGCDAWVDWLSGARCHKATLAGIDRASEAIARLSARAFAYRVIVTRMTRGM